MRRRARARKLGLSAGIGTIVVGIAFIAMTGIAWAHHPVVSGVTSCGDPDHLITWTIGNSESTHSMSITSATAELNGTTYSVTGYASPLPPSGSTTATTTIPGDLTGTVTLTVTGHWSDGFNATRTATVDLTDPCTVTTTSPPTTETTSPPTTETTSPPTTETTSPPTTETTAPSTTTTPTTVTIETTTTTAGGIGISNGQGTPPGNLPFTGSATVGLLLVALGLIAVGTVLVGPRRRSTAR